MAKKKAGINFKQILVQKGERYGFYAAAALLMLFLVLGGFKAASSASSGAIVEKFNKGVSSIDRKIAGKGDQPKEIDPAAYGDPTVARIEFTKYAVRDPWWNISANEQTKRLNPHLYPPIESQVDFVRGDVLIYDVIEEGGKRLIAVIKERQRTANDPRSAIPKKKLKGGQAAPPPPQPQPLPPPGVPGGGGRLGGAPPPGGPGRPGGPGMGVGPMARTTESTIEYKDLDDPDIESAVRAENISPQRMVVISLAVPYKAQVEEYRRALRAQSKDTLSEFPEYQGFVVERRMVSPDGKTVEQDWTPLDVVGNMRELFNRSIDVEPETPPRNLPADEQALFQRILPPQEFKLLYPRPKLYRGEYPPVEMKSISDALKSLVAQGVKTTDVKTGINKQLQDDDPFNRSSTGGQGDRIGGAPIPGGPGGGRPGMRTIGGPAQPGVNAALNRAEDEDAWLMRFIDITVQAGHGYQYRVAVKALNPNHGKPAKELAVPSLADKELLQSDFFEVPTTVVVPPEEFLYAAVKERNHQTEKMPGPGNWDETWVQLQKWYANIRADEFPRAEPFGEWLVADIKALRGQFIGERGEIPLPFWSMTKSLFLQRDNMKRGSRATGVIAGARPKANRNWTLDLFPGAPPGSIVLVDFEGGTGEYFGPKNKATRDTPGVEMLLMTQDGKLRVARSGQDMSDPDRVKRKSGWDEWLQKVEQDTVMDAAGAPAGGPAGPAGPGGERGPGRP